MKNPIDFAKYLITGLILLLSVSGNQPLEASRIKGHRRNWEVKTSRSGTEFPTFRDNCTTNTAICAAMKLTGLNRITSPQLSELIIKGAPAKTSDNIPSSIQSSATQWKYNLPKSKVPKVSDHYNAFFPKNIILRLICLAKLPATGTRLKPVTLFITEMFRYLERLPGH